MEAAEGVLDLAAWHEAPPVMDVVQALVDKSLLRIDSGRHDIDDTQELNYRFIAQAIVDLNFTGYFAHEYTPAEGHDPIATLNRAIEICDV